MDTAKLKIDPVAWDPDERYVWYDHHFIGAVKPAASGTGYDVLAPGDKPGEPSLHISHANSHVDGAEQLARRWLARQDEKKAAAEARAPKNPRKIGMCEDDRLKSVHLKTASSREHRG